MTSWVYHLSKPQLTQQVTDRGIPAATTVTELRRQLCEHIMATKAASADPGAKSTRPQEAPRPTLTVSNEDGEPERFLSARNTPEPNPVQPTFPTKSEPPVIPTTIPLEEHPAHIATQVRKWGCHFDGKDPLSFLEHLEEQCAAYGFREEQLLPGLPTLLRGDALLWYRNNRESWQNWADFRRDFTAQYLPPGYQRQLRREIQGRKQKTGETFTKYVTTVLTMMRRAGGYSEPDRLEQIYENADPDLQLYVRLEEVRSVTELSSRAAEFEEKHRRRAENKREIRRSDEDAQLAAATYDRATHCWRCKQRGHTRTDCRRPARKFCSQCGRDGVLTRDCHPPAGNDRRVGSETAADRPASA